MMEQEEVEETLRGINYKALVLGSMLTLFLACFGFVQGLEWIVYFSSIGLLIVGYTGKTLKQGTILGAIAGIPLGIAGIYGALGTYDQTVEWKILILAMCILTGAFIGFVGSYFHKNRDAAIEYREKQEKIGKNKNKKKNKK